MRKRTTYSLPSPCALVRRMPHAREASVCADAHTPGKIVGCRKELGNAHGCRRMPRDSA
ncbi:MAG: hypothetical protein V4681_02990 [Patescibacteria group bacterium]